MTDDRVADLHAHLAATAELPLPREANAWLGEAEAVAADLAAGDPDEAVVAERVAVVGELLDNVGTTGHPEADEHVAAARALVADVRERGPPD